MVSESEPRAPPSCVPPEGATLPCPAPTLLSASVDKLDALTRLLDNGAADPDDVDGLKEEVEFYLEQVGDGRGGVGLKESSASSR